MNLLTGEEIILIASIISVYISRSYSEAEVTTLANLFSCIGQNLGSLLAQDSLFDNNGDKNSIIIST